MNYEGVPVYTVGHYFAYTQRTRWTKWLKQMKANCRQELVAPLAQIMADFAYERTPVLKSADVLVPVPPDPAKYNKRGFAPNDDICAILQQRLAMPARRAIIRRGGDTRGSSLSQLAGQFEVDSSEARSIAGLKVLLVEDIWTLGRTIPICAEKLRAAGAKEVMAIALAESTF
jgi:predicted amidophosphoribosyltransferase